MSEATASFEHFIAGASASVLAPWIASSPWDITSQSEAIVRQILRTVSTAEFTVSGEIAVHVTATVENGAVLKAPVILGANCFVAAGAYLRGGNWIGERCTFGPGAELKSSFVFPGTKLAHFNFVGDSILGSDVNLEAGSVICNYRNERPDKDIRVRIGGMLRSTGRQKFGALVGDGSRIGSNAVVAPGALLIPGSIVTRASLRDDDVPPIEPGAGLYGAAGP